MLNYEVYADDWDEIRSLQCQHSGTLHQVDNYIVTYTDLTVDIRRFVADKGCTDVFYATSDGLVLPRAVLPGLVRILITVMEEENIT